MNPKFRTRLLVFFIALFLVLLFVWKTKVGEATAAPRESALNTRLPEPGPAKDSWWDKMDFYKQAEKDSARSPDSVARPLPLTAAVTPAAVAPIASVRPVLPVPPAPPVLPPPPAPPVAFSPAIRSLPPAPDPELAQLGVLLDKVLAIQHPQAASPPPAPPVNAPAPDTAIPALTETASTITSGSVLALRTTTEAHYHGLLIPGNTLLYGTATLEGERLHVQIKSIRMGDLLCPVSLEAYDQDGIEGIYIPGVPARDDVRTSADGLVSGLNYGTPASQAAGAGIQTLKNLFSKKIREVRVTVRENYGVWLK